MKDYTTLLFLLIVISCSHADKTISKTSKPKMEDSSVVIDFEIAEKAGIKQHQLSMYNEKYELTIIPSLELRQNLSETNILLTKNSDTIFLKHINIDSLANTILKHRIFADSSEYSKIASEYQLQDIKYRSVRTNDLYFVATISSETRRKELDVLFQISYLTKGEIGKLFVNGYGEGAYRL